MTAEEVPALGGIDYQHSVFFTLSSASKRYHFVAIPFYYCFLCPCSLYSSKEPEGLICDCGHFHIDHQTKDLPPELKKRRKEEKARLKEKWAKR